VSLHTPLHSPNLERRDSGIWFARQNAAVSFPSGGHALCLALEDRSFWFRHRNRCVVSVVRRFPPDGVLVDIGGGNGYVAKGLSDAGIACVLVEPGIDGALAAHARGIDPVICARLEDLALPAASIAAAGMFDVLEHIEDEAAALHQIHGLLKPGGRMFLTVPAYQFLTSDEDRAAGHYRRYTLRGLRTRLEAARFEIAYASYLFSPLPPLLFCLRTVPSQLGICCGMDPERATAEHAPGGRAERAMNRLLTMEYRRIEEGRTLPFGGSCLCVATKA
jgi:SAM-dependent methyltransferase